MRVDYDEIRGNPREAVTTMENSFLNKFARGGSFAMHPLAIVEVPERERLRKHMQEKYGIEGIDDYFVPIIVDTTTYRALINEPEPSIWDWVTGRTGSHGHVKRLGDSYISYVSAEAVIDHTLEHEAIHAHFFRHNDHYKHLASRVGFTGLLPRSSRDASWIEAVPWVATGGDFNFENVFKSYSATFGGKTTPYKRIKNSLLVCLGAVYEGLNEAYKKFKSGKDNDIPIAVARRLHLTALGLIASQRSRKKEEAEWKKSFDLARRLKDKLGVKEFLQIASRKHRSELLEESI